MPINIDRLWKRLERLAAIGADAAGGTSRFTYTPEYVEAKDLVTGWMKEAGLTVRTDAAGNTIGRIDGRNAEAPAVLLGSHIDTVQNGGRFDGPVGVLGAIEAVQLAVESGILFSHPVEVVVFVEEEGGRFGSSLLGSRAMMGQLPEDILQRTDKNGVTLAQAMKGAGLDHERLHDAVRQPADISAYLEMHIEQGTVLDSLGRRVGVVTDIAGPFFLNLTIRGRAGHAGATPMDRRQDALVAAAEIISAAESMARESSSALVMTVGRISVKPGAINIIPGEVVMSVDIRDVDKGRRDNAAAALRHRIGEICLSRGVECRVEELLNVPPVPLSARVIGAIATACRELGLPEKRLVSGAGHDAQVLAQFVDAGMIFLRSKNGISHAPEEWTDKEDIHWGTEVLYRSLLALAK
ncbi:MAG: Zn-dependent hydrolase [Chloroflexi bacterium]|nr:Zn-dependent hydrolase [Chloroflexota bacterium]